MTLRNYSSTAAETTLSSGVDASTTTLTVSATTGFPATPFVLAIDAGAAAQELVLVTNVAGTTLTVTRAFDSTVASAHNVGAVVAHSHAAIDFREANTHVNAEDGVHGVTGDVVGTTDAQTLTNKTLALGSNAVSGTKAQFNTAVTDGNPVWADEVGLWQAYTPTVVNGSLGAGGTVVGRYVQIGKTVHFRALVTLGTGFSMVNSFGVTLPIAAHSTITMGPDRVRFGSTGNNVYLGFASWGTTSMTGGVPGTNGAGVALASTVPFTWKATDTLEFGGTYEAA